MSPYAPAAAKPASRGKGSGAHIVFKREQNPAESAPSKDALFGVSLVELARRHGANLDRGYANILASLSPSLLRADGALSCLQRSLLPCIAVIISSASSEEVSQLRMMCDKGNFDGLSACAAGHLLGLLILFLKELPQALLPFSVRSTT